MPQRRPVWDLPTRVFHWALVALISFSWWSAEYGHLDWHAASGATILALLIFRTLWGIYGATTARFSQFVKGPRAVYGYLRPRERSDTVSVPGHNPLGSWSVVTLLILLSAQVISGLFAVDVDGIESGPLSSFISFDQGRTAAAVHHFTWNLILVLIPLHIVAILFYLAVKRRNLIWPMIIGSEPATPGPGLVTVPVWRLLASVVAAAVLAWWVYHGFHLS